MSQARTVFKALVLSLALMVLVVIGVGQLLAPKWSVETTRTLPFPPAQVAALVHDLASWSKWAAVDINLGPQTAREVAGSPAGTDQRITWSGQLGKAELAVTRLDATGLDYRIGFVMAQAPSPGAGQVTWVADGSGSRVVWRDDGNYDSVLLRWFGWFGALQERVKQVQRSSLEGLLQELEQKAGK